MNSHLLNFVTMIALPHIAGFVWGYMIDYDLIKEYGLVLTD